MRTWGRAVVLAAAVTAGGAASVFAGPSPEREERVGGPVAVQQVSILPTAIRDDAAMLLVGTALIGLAAVVRRTA